MSVRRQPARIRLLQAADELFYERGIAGTGVDAVIERAGVATGSLYKNFRGKDDLVVAYLADRDSRWRALWEECITAETDPQQRILAIFTAIERWRAGTSLARGCSHVAAAGQLPPGHPGLDAVAEHKRHVVARLTTEVAAAGVTDAGETARDIALVYDGMLSAMAVGLEPDPIGRARRIAQRLLAP
ncbi:TetR/AcrR family transcriptional regulator [Mycolicibacterium litorale]|nr:TetR/AcrR family transcriptional regulator [Mycolicibacterium litorale]MCV7415870.1 TetR/AcrR family transcriptional regulator [Mycolicibacterium litorale]TDY09121.1 TetR family transcriptional regulator [Mycolicibacterium litorale]